LIVPTRAFENKVYVVAVDRVGRERGTDFIGLSKIVDTMGDTLAEASADKEEVLYAEVYLATARQKRTVLKAGEFEWDFISDRRPEFYGEITKNTN
jgi:predicted amidohydrolase